MPTDTPDQQITRPVDADTADNPVAFTNMLADVEPRLVRRYTNEADRTARMTAVSEGDVSHLAAEDRTEVYTGTTHVSLFTRSVWAEKVRTTDAAAINNSTVLVNDATLVVALPTAGRFHFDLLLFYDASTTADIKVAFTIPAGASIRWAGVGGNNTLAAGSAPGMWLAANASGTSVTFGANGTTAANMVAMMAKGAVVMGGTAGNLQLQYAQATADPTDLIVRSSSRLTLWRVS